MLGLAKYLHEFGWDPIMLTAPLERPIDVAIKARVLESDYPGDVFSFWRTLLGKVGLNTSESMTEQIKLKVGGATGASLAERARTLYQEVLAYPDTERRWKNPALALAKQFVERERVDGVLSVWPVTSHLIARELKTHYSLPWVADFPDLWTQNHNYPYTALRKAIETRFELRTMSSADALSTISESLAMKLRNRYQSKEVFVIPNGFDPETVNDRPSPVTDDFTITYTGSIYRDKQDPEKLLIALRDLIDLGMVDGSKVHVRFYGATHGWLTQMAKSYRLENVVTQYGWVSRSQSFEKQRESQILLAYGWEDGYETGVFPVKVFEYFAARRPILVTGGTPKEQFRAMLDDTAAGRHGIELPEIKQILKQYYDEFKERGVVAYRGVASRTDRYSMRSLARGFAEAFDRVHVKADKGGHSLEF